MLSKKGAPSGPSIILIHGLSDSWFSYSRVLPLLKEDCTTYALSQRGHGDSERPAGGYNMSDFASDVIAFMDALGIDQATLVGHSMGSLVAQQVALDAPQRLSRLVLVGAGTHIQSEMGYGLQEAVSSLPDPVPAEFVAEFQQSTIYHPVPAEFLETVIAESVKLPLHVWQGALAGTVGCNYTGKLGALRIPTLILRGSEDGVFPGDAQNALESEVPGATVKVYPETGHALHWERPEQFAEDVNAFLA